MCSSGDSAPTHSRFHVQPLPGATLHKLPKMEWGQACILAFLTNGVRLVYLHFFLNASMQA